MFYCREKETVRRGIQKRMLNGKHLGLEPSTRLCEPEKQPEDALHSEPLEGKIKELLPRTCI